MSNLNNIKGVNKMQDLLSTKEAAKLINVSPNTLTQWRVRKLFGVPFFTADEMHERLQKRHPPKLSQNR